MPKYTLTYFDLMGRAEASRYMFKLAGVDFKDARIAGKEWPKFKPTTPLGQVPILEVDGGKRLCQSYAVHGYVASELGFYGANNWERAQIDEVVETGRDITPHIAAFFAADEAGKAEQKKTNETEVFPKILANAEKLLERNNGGYVWFVGGKVSFADIVFFGICYDFYPILVGKQPDLSSFPKLAELIKKFQGLPEVAKWIKERPVTSM